MRPTSKPTASEIGRRRAASCCLWRGRPNATAAAKSVHMAGWHEPATCSFTSWLDKDNTVMRVKCHTRDIGDAGVFVFMVDTCCCLGVEVIARICCLRRCVCVQVGKLGEGWASMALGVAATVPESSHPLTAAAIRLWRSWRGRLRLARWARLLRLTVLLHPRLPIIQVRSCDSSCVQVLGHPAVRQQ